MVSNEMYQIGKFDMIIYIVTISLCLISFVYVEAIKCVACTQYGADKATWCDYDIMKEVTCNELVNDCIMYCFVVRTLNEKNLRYRKVTGCGFGNPQVGYDSCITLDNKTVRDYLEPDGKIYQYFCHRCTEDYCNEHYNLGGSFCEDNTIQHGINYTKKPTTTSISSVTFDTIEIILILIVCFIANKYSSIIT